MATKEITLPTGKPINQVVVDVFRRTSNQQTVFDLFGVFVLRPAIASFAERDFVPLRGLVVVSRLGEFLALPDFVHAVFEYVAHVGRAHSVETAQPHAACVKLGPDHPIPLTAFPTSVRIEQNPKNRALKKINPQKKSLFAMMPGCTFPCRVARYGHDATKSA